MTKTAESAETISRKQEHRRYQRSYWQPTLHRCHAFELLVFRVAQLPPYQSMTFKLSTFDKASKEDPGDHDAGFICLRCVHDPASGPASGRVLRSVTCWFKENTRWISQQVQSRHFTVEVGISAGIPNWVALADDPSSKYDETTNSLLLCHVCYVEKRTQQTCIEAAGPTCQTRTLID